MQNIVTKEQLITDLSNIGLREGDELYMHSSLKSMGWLEDGPQTLLDAILSVIGSGGTLAVPAHSLNYLLADEYTEVIPYDGTNPAKTGAFSNFLIKHPCSYRSGSPTHSSVAIGRRAEYYTANHDPANPFGLNSPLRRLYENEAKILLLGVSNKANTILHLAEAMAADYMHIPCYRCFGAFARLIDENGMIKDIEQEIHPGCSGNFTHMDGFFKYHDITRYGRIASARSQYLMAKPMVDLAIKIIREKPDFFLCVDDNSHGCDERREWALRKK